MQRFTGRRETCTETRLAIVGPVSDRFARRPARRKSGTLELRTKVGPGGRRPARALAALPEGPDSSATRTFRRLAIARTGHRPLIGTHFCSQLLLVLARQAAC
nr:hypothetical protein StreXyl84_65930 [Streptomyces sp. Xyl84]